jgi:hypothetical protein
VGRGRGREVVMRGIDERVMVTMINVEVMVMMEGGKKEGVMGSILRNSGCISGTLGALFVSSFASPSSCSS